MAEPTKGTLVRSTLGGPTMVVTDSDDRFVYIKRADFAKKYWTKEGSGIASRIDFWQDYKKVSA